MYEASQDRSPEQQRTKSIVLAELAGAMRRGAIAHSVARTGEFTYQDITGGISLDALDERARSLEAEARRLGATDEEIDAEVDNIIESITELIDL